MPARPDARRLAAWRALLHAHATLTHQLGRELEAECNLPLSQYEVLLRLAEAPEGRLRMQELARSVRSSKSGLTRLVDRMEGRGLVVRQECPSDRRGWFAVLTPAGRATLRRAATVHLRGIQEHFARHLDDHEAELLTAALTRTIRAAQPGAPALAADCAPEPPS